MKIRTSTKIKNEHPDTSIASFVLMLYTFVDD